MTSTDRGQGHPSSVVNEARNKEAKRISRRQMSFKNDVLDPFFLQTISYQNPNFWILKEFRNKLPQKQ